MSKLDRWNVCKEETALVGAASAFLSISDLGLILDSPLWCSALTNRKILEYYPLWNKRIYSTLLEENDLVFGTKKKLLEVVQDMQQDAQYTVIGVAINCAPALIGDDVESICKSAFEGPICVADAIGFVGEADKGWSEAMLSLLKKVPCFSPKKQSRKINVLGESIFHPRLYGSMENTLFIPGYLSMRYEELSLLSEATINLVVHPRALAVAKWLELNTKVPYIVWDGECLNELFCKEDK